MKLARYILITAGIVALLAAIAWYLRDTLIERISNPMLQEYGIEVIDVSLDALATSDATIGYLELAHEKGTTIAIEGLMLPIGAASTGSKTYTANKVSVITSTRTDGEPFELAQLIDQFLSLPDNLGDSKVVVGEFNLPPYPTLRNLRWVLTKDQQTLHWSVASIDMSATITVTDATNYAVVFSLPTASATTDGHAVVAHMRKNGQGISLSGESTLTLPAWEPLGKLAGIVPEEIAIQAGAAKLRFDVEIPYDTGRTPSMSAELVQASLLQLTYSNMPDQTTSVVVESGSPVVIEASFPDVEWSLRQMQTSLRATYGEWTEIPVSISNLTCQSPPVCSMNTSTKMNVANLPIGNVDRVELSSTLDVAFPQEGMQVGVQPGATLHLSGLSSTGANIKRVDAELVSAATMEFVDAGWQLEAESLDANFDAVRLSEDVTVTTPLFLESLRVNELNETLTAKFGLYSSSIQGDVGGQAIAFPGLKGKVALRGADVALDVQTIGLHQDGTIDAEHNLDSGVGSFSIDGAAVSFGAQKLSNRVMPWRQDWDLVTGTVAVDLRARWSRSNSSTELAGEASVRLEDLAGHYADTAFAGLSTSVETVYDSTTGFTSQPSTITAALVEMGVPIENISADYTLDVDQPGIEIENLHMTAFGGIIRADPFSFYTSRDTNNLTLHAESIELTELLSLNEFEAIEVSGSIGANVPVTIESDAVTIVGGTLAGEPPGGVIRYLRGGESDETDTSSIAMATRALSNFEYESLTSEVSLNREGDLKLQLQLTGRNPDLYDNRPIVLNLGVDNNVPQMLKSLRAARAVEEILEKRLRE